MRWPSSTQATRSPAVLIHHSTGRHSGLQVSARQGRCARAAPSRQDLAMVERWRPRVRRSSAEVRSLVLAAARELFEDRGYDQVSTRDIATRAGVTQALVFRHFGTKVDLFVEAVYLPFSTFISVYLDRWAEGRTDDGQASVRDTEAFVAGLYQLLLENRKMLATLANLAGDTSSVLPVRARPVLAE